MRGEREKAPAPERAIFRRRLRSVGALVELGRRGRGDLDRQLLLSAMGSTEARCGALFRRSEEGRLTLSCGMNLAQEELPALPKAAARFLDSHDLLPLAKADAGLWSKWLRELRLAKLPAILLPLEGPEGVDALLYLCDRPEAAKFGADERGLLETLGGLYALLRDKEPSGRRNQPAGSESLKQLRRAWPPLRRFIGDSKVVADLLSDLVSVAPSNCPVLLQGDSGTGKEMLAHLVHDLSRADGGPFEAINCGALPEGLLESELFGHVAGAFTGASRDHKGIFARANGGTVFLDEIGELSPNAQVRLLRVLQEGCFVPVGGEKEERCDGRIIAATHRDLREEMAAGRFREDLFYRLHVFPLRVPTLRERRGDIALLVQHFLGQDIRGASLDSTAMRRLEAYSWPGNIRELENMVRALKIEARGSRKLSDRHVVAVFSRMRTPLPAESKPTEPNGKRALGPWVLEELRRAAFNLSRAERALETRRRQGDQEVKVSSRSGLGYYLQGESLRALAANDWQVEAAALSVAGRKEDLPRVHGKLQRMVEGASSAWEQGGRSQGARFQALSRRFSKLPEEYGPDLQAFEGALREGKLKAD